MWYRFEQDNPKGICRVKQFQIAWYDMQQNGDCFDEDFVALDGIDRVIPYVETVEDENNSDRSRVFVHMDNGDVYELKMEKLSKEQLENCNNFYCEDVIKPCDMCNNARIDDDLTNENDYSAISVGKSAKGNRIMLCSGDGKPPRIEFEEWNDKAGWGKIAEYRPRYCPNCGRKIVEYND